MKTIILEISAALKAGEQLDDKALNKILNKHNQNLKSNSRHYSKKKLLPYYLATKNNRHEQWKSWNITPELEKQLMRVLQIKPRRTASGVATITVITKPKKCSSNCLYCPSDVRMPKSYMSDEPACQRAERNYFDPYLQVTSRIRALTQMGHITDKIELIVLGGTWSDYSPEYQRWFIKELFRALNDDLDAEPEAKKRRTWYKSLGLTNDSEELIKQTESLQQAVDNKQQSYNSAISTLYENNPSWISASLTQQASLEELLYEHSRNEYANHRVVGLVVETRPDTINPDSLYILRQLGCTKIQMGVQSLNADILKANQRTITTEVAAHAFELVRLFGFKIHAHFMTNLFGATPEADKQDYLDFVQNPAFQPDEIKLYPCVLITGTQLCERFNEGTWQPYTEEELVDVLIEDTLNTPAFTRISRMIRDFSAHDIVAGNKKVNLRQLVENRIAESGRAIKEIRSREISTDSALIDELHLDIVPYTTSATDEFFLQWVTPENKIAGFLRLSLPHQAHVAEHEHELPINLGEGMIREVHVYGKVSKLHNTGDGAQHLGLGKKLIEQAKQIAKERGFTHLNVISSVGTREYYRKLGFTDAELYQKIAL